MGRRTMKLEGVRNLRERCRRSETVFYFKQDNAFRDTRRSRVGLPPGPQCHGLMLCQLNYTQYVLSSKANRTDYNSFRARLSSFFHSLSNNCRFLVRGNLKGRFASRGSLGCERWEAWKVLARQRSHSSSRSFSIIFDLS
jgi:hypothetical protein